MRLAAALALEPPLTAYRARFGLRNLLGGQAREVLLATSEWQDSYLDRAQACTDEPPLSNERRGELAACLERLRRLTKRRRW